MTEDEIARRMTRVMLAFGEKSNIDPLTMRGTVSFGERGSFLYGVDFSGGRSAEQLHMDALSIINEIMGLRDRAKAWMKNNGGDVSLVDKFIKAEQSVALVHDLANADKHGKLDGPPFSGVRPTLPLVERAMTLKFDPETETYSRQAEFLSPVIGEDGSVTQSGTSNGVEVALIGAILDERGSEVARLEKVLPIAILRWEKFLASIGLNL